MHSGIKKNSRAGRGEEKNGGGRGARKKKRSKEKIRPWWSTTFPKLARFLAEGQGRETMQRCADPGIYRRSLEHWAIGRRVRERRSGGGGLSALFSKAKHRRHYGALWWLKPVGERGWIGAAELAVQSQCIENIDLTDSTRVRIELILSCLPPTHQTPIAQPL